MTKTAWLLLLLVAAACGKSGEGSSDDAITAGSGGEKAGADAASAGRTPHRDGGQGGHGGKGGRGAEADADAGPGPGPNDHVSSVDVKQSEACTMRAVSSSVSAQSDADLDMLAGVTHLTGSIEISGNVSKLDALKCLSTLDGSLTVRSADSLAEILLPELVQVTGGIHVQSGKSIAKISVPRLETAGEIDAWSLYLFDLPKLSELDLTSLRELSAGLSMSSSGQDADGQLMLGLKALSHIGGSLRLEKVSHLQDLRGFENLAEIDGELQLLSNADLASAALPKLTKLSQRLDVESDNALTVIDLSALASVGEADSYSLYFQDLPKLTMFDAHSLKELPATLFMSVVGDSADAPLSLELSGLVLMRGSLHFDNVRRLINLDGLSALAEVTGDLHVLSSPGFTSIALPALKKLGGLVNVQTDTALSTLDLHALAAVGAGGGCSLYIYNLPQLTVLDASSLIELPAAMFLSTLGQSAGQSLSLRLSSLALIRGTLTLQNLSGLANVDALAKLTEISDALDVTSNTELASLSLPALNRLGGRVNIRSNPALETIDLHALAKLGSEENYSLYIHELPKLKALDVSSLREAPAGIRVQQLGGSANTALSLKLDSLTVVGGGIQLASLARLEHLDTLAKLTHIAQNLDILSNPVLTSLSGLNALQMLDGHLWISNNTTLSTCAAKALATRLKPADSFWDVTILNNDADGC